MAYKLKNLWKKGVLLLFVILLVSLFSISVALEVKGQDVTKKYGELLVVEWEKTFRGSTEDEPDDRAYSIEVAADGGYVLVGDANGKAWVVKVDQTGSVIWERVLAGSEGCLTCYYPRSISRTSDGNFVVGGYYYKSILPNSGYFPFLAKLNAEGSILWMSEEWVDANGSYISGTLYSARETTDGGYVVLVNRNNHISLVKINSQGAMLWEKKFIHGAVDFGLSLQQTSDRGYIIVGWTATTTQASSCDVYLIKTDSYGNMVWEKTFGGGDHDAGYSVQEVADGYIVAGLTRSYGAGEEDIYLVKIDTQGNIVWSKTYGGDKFDSAFSILQAFDGGFVIVGTTSSFGPETLIKEVIDTSADYYRFLEELNRARYYKGDNIYLIRTSADGSLLWAVNLGGNGVDRAYSVRQTLDGGFILAGTTNSHKSNDNNGTDFYLLKIASEFPTTYTLTITKTGTGFGTVTSNPAGISCGSDCSEVYTAGTVVTLTATPSSGSTFSGWGGDCSSCGGNPNCQVSMTSNKSCVATFNQYITSSILYANDIFSLYTIDVNNGDIRKVGDIGIDWVSDIAFYGDTLYGITLLNHSSENSTSQFLIIDRATGIGRVIGDTGFKFLSGLAVSSNGTIYAVSEANEDYIVSCRLIKIDPQTGRGTLIKDFGTQLSCYDLAFAPNGELYATVESNNKYYLTKIDLSRGNINLIGEIGYEHVWGISFIDNLLYGVTWFNGELIEIDTNTGAGRLISDTNLSFYGLTTYSLSGLVNLRLITPNGREEVPAGGNYTITWQAPQNAHHFTLQLSTDNRQTWSVIKRNVTGNSYNWKVPVPENNKRQSFIRVIAFDSANNRIGSDRSDRAFTIEVVKVTSPNGGETLKSGSTYTITWRTNQTIRPVAKVSLSYTTDGGATWKGIKTFTGTNPGSFRWKVPAVDSPKTQCKIRVILRDSAGAVVGSDVSDSYFTINP
uniref:Bacterial repeat domain-containing protein n=1 Tax=Thermodesulfobacterium geofontis TaxID=1295609 RepID=A0A7V5XIA6_9BACT